MNQETKDFIKALKLKPGVLGIILFGSWARGDNRPNSDVDLIVILDTGFQRAVEFVNQQAFEITYTTAESAYQYWESHKDDAFDLWEVAKILYDKTSIIDDLKLKTITMLKNPKDSYSETQLKHLRFDAEDQIRYVKDILKNDRTTANFIINNKVFNLTEVFFNIRQLWIPAPKQRLSKIRDNDAKFYALLVQFYNQESIEEKIGITEKMVSIIFKL